MFFLTSTGSDKGRYAGIWHSSAVVEFCILINLHIIHEYSSNTYGVSICISSPDITFLDLFKETKVKLNVCSICTKFLPFLFPPCTTSEADHCIAGQQSVKFTYSFLLLKKNIILLTLFQLEILRNCSSMNLVQSSHILLISLSLTLFLTLSLSPSIYLSFYISEGIFQSSFKQALDSLVQPLVLFSKNHQSCWDRHGTRPMTIPTTLPTSLK